MSAGSASGAAMTSANAAGAARAREAVEDIYPLSPMQEGMLLHTLLAPRSGVYFLQTTCRLAGELDVASLARAWRRALDRHAVLRTAFLGESLEKPVQVVLRHAELPFASEDWRALPPAEQAARRRALLAADREQGFEVAAAPLLRLALLRTGEREHDLVFSYHHLLLDAWSGQMLLAEVFADYLALCAGREAAPPTRRPYRDYIAWLQGRDLAGAEAYWRRRLAGVTAPTPLASDRPASREATPPDAYGTLSRRLSPELTSALQSLARQSRSTLNAVVQAAWALLLARSAGEPDVLYGLVVAGRPTDLAGAESMIGLFINTLPMRMTLDLAASPADLARQVQAAQAEVLPFEHSPLVQVQGWSQVPRNLPLFESIFAFANYPHGQWAGGLTGDLSVIDSHTEERVHYALTVEARLDPELRVDAHFEHARFDPPTVARLLAHLERLLAGAAASPGEPAAGLPLLGPAERHQLLAEWNDTEKPCPQEPMVHELVSAHARLRPHAAAVVAAGLCLTYGELEARSNRLAHRLRALGVGPETLVTILTERTPERVIGLAAVLKAGGAYVSLDPAYPPERLAWLLADAGAPVLLAEQRLLGRLPETAAQVICLDAGLSSVAGDHPPDSGVGPDNLAYVIYTSGSTGRPKGVEIPHRGLMNLVRWHQDLYGVRPEDHGTQVASPAFDASVWELWPYLAAGASVHIPDEETRLSSAGMVRWWAEQGITLAYLMTPLAEGVLAEPAAADAVTPAAVRALIVGGDRLRGRPRPGAGFRLMNHYGPAEYTVTSTVGEVSAESRTETLPAVGRPIDNTRLHVLDRDLQPVPTGVTGELYVGGVGLARGYLHDPARTAEKLLPAPFAAAPGERLYRTGDLGRHLADGSLECLGRIDFQVKLRGFRIELGEIEARLREHPGVADAVAAVWQRAGREPRLAAYVIAAGEAPAGRELREFLREKLPEPMVPSSYVFLASFPSTPNGKLDRRALPAPDAADLDATFVAPRSELEQRIAEVWRQALGVERIGVHDNFFDLGGHSLLLSKVVEKLRQALGRPLALVEAFRYPSIHELAAHLAAESTGPTAAERRRQAAEELEKGRLRAEARRDRQRQGLRRGGTP